MSSLPAWRSPRAWGTMVIVFAVALSADLWSKSWAFRNVAGKPVVLVYEGSNNGSGNDNDTFNEFCWLPETRNESYIYPSRTVGSGTR